VRAVIQGVVVVILSALLGVALTHNPLTYEVEALRALLVGTSTILWLDFVVLAGATVAGITASSLLLPRLARLGTRTERE
jgi:ABC-2 type transport system permease protein